jgi:hypothetical protein
MEVSAPSRPRTDEPQATKRPLAPEGREVVAVPPCCADTLRWQPRGLRERGGRNPAHSEVPGPVTGPTRRSLLWRRRVRQFDARLRGAYPAGGRAPSSQPLRLSVASPDPRTLLVLAVVWCCIGALAARYARLNRTALSGEWERAEGRGDKHATPPSPHLAEHSAGVCTLPPTMWVGCQASSGRCPSATLLMRANARVQLLHKGYLWTSVLVKTHREWARKPLGPAGKDNGSSGSGQGASSPRNASGERASASWRPRRACGSAICYRAEVFARAGCWEAASQGRNRSRFVTPCAFCVTLWRHAPSRPAPVVPHAAFAGAIRCPAEQSLVLPGFDTMQARYEYSSVKLSMARPAYQRRHGDAACSDRLRCDPDKRQRARADHSRCLMALCPLEERTQPSKRLGLALAGAQ